jgi:hypothetical protein
VSSVAIPPGGSGRLLLSLTVGLIDSIGPLTAPGGRTRTSRFSAGARPLWRP